MRVRLLLAAGVTAAIACPGLSFAQPAPSSDVSNIKHQLERQSREIAAQRKLLDRQQQLIDALEKKLSPQVAAAPPVQSQPVQPPPGVAASRSEAAAQRQPVQQAAGAARNAAETPTRPIEVGQAPEEKTRPPEIQTLASVGGVLTRKNTLVLEPYAEYVHSSLNQFTFEGIQIIDALLIGVINAGRTQQDLGIAGATLRYGITDRLEAEVRAPFVYRTQSLNGTLINSNNTVLRQTAHGSGLGDIEGAVHYQINGGKDGWPFLIANVRYKSDTGSSPWSVPYNTDGSARELPTGSGFSAINPSLTVIYPADPAVLYANAGWIHNFADGKSLMINNATISNIEPGDTFSGSVGLGVALNDTVSFSLGYQQDYIDSTSELLNGIPQKAQSLLAGALALGITLRTSDQNSINFGLSAGVTRDSPDVAVTIRAPISLDVAQYFTR